MSTDFELSILTGKPLFKTADPDKVDHYMSNAFRPNHSKLVGHDNRVNFSHQQVTIASTSINDVRYGKEAYIEVPPSNDVYLGMFTITGSAEVHYGKQKFYTRPETFCILNPTQPLNFHLSEDFEQLTIRIDSKTVKQALIEATEVDLVKLPKFLSQNFNLTGGAASFSRLIKTICHDIGYEHSAFVKPHVSKHMERALVNLLLEEFPHNYSKLLNESLANPAPYYVKRAEEYIIENLCSPLTMDEIATVSGTSLRSLQSGFKKFRDTTLSVYIRNRRLVLARQKLLKPMSSDDNITEIAMACGFTHLSKFSRYYRERFGESPSETQKKLSLKLR